MQGSASQWLPVICQGTVGSGSSVTSARVSLLAIGWNDNRPERCDHGARQAIDCRFDGSLQLWHCASRPSSVAAPPPPPNRPRAFSPTPGCSPATPLAHGCLPVGPAGTGYSV